MLFRSKEGAPLAKVIHVADSPGQVATHLTLAGRAAGDLTTVLDGIRNAVQERATRPDWSDWAADLADRVRAVEERDRELLTAEADPVHPARIYGELLPRLADDAVVIGDGGDFVSTGNGLSDCDAHGTLVAGLIAARPDPADDFVGLAPGVTLISIRQSSAAFSPPRRPADDDPEATVGSGFGSVAYLARPYQVVRARRLNVPAGQELAAAADVSPRTEL